MNQTNRKSKESILANDFITCTDVRYLLCVGAEKARYIFTEVQKKVESEGKLNVPGKISWRKMYKMLGEPIPDIKKEG